MIYLKIVDKFTGLFLGRVRSDASLDIFKTEVKICYCNGLKGMGIETHCEGSSHA